jgi:1,4-dihydroxy-2-naphthoyl-CoA hydrolase
MGLGARRRLHCDHRDLATAGAYEAVKDRGQLAVGVTNVADFLRLQREGRLNVVAEPIQQGRTQQLWQVVITGAEDGKAVARGQVHAQNIDASIQP